MGVEAERIRLEVVAMKAKGDETEPQKLELLGTKIISKIDFIHHILLKNVSIQFVCHTQKVAQPMCEEPAAYQSIRQHLIQHSKFNPACWGAEKITL